MTWFTYYWKYFNLYFNTSWVKNILLNNSDINIGLNKHLVLLIIISLNSQISPKIISLMISSNHHNINIRLLINKNKGLKLTPRIIGIGRKDMWSTWGNRSKPFKRKMIFWEGKSIVDGAIDPLNPLSWFLNKVL